ncbi:MAG: MMPL family transporter [Pirellulales bacterium]|nr:MMPL family transporter [Pirellulales bacterium]
MRPFFRLVTARPIPILCLAGLLAGVLGLYVLQLDRDTSPDAFIPAGHPAMALKKKVEDAFGLTEPIAVGVIRDAPGGIFRPKSLRLIQRLTGEIQALVRNLDPAEPGRPDDVLSLATISGVYFRDGEPGFEPVLREIPDDPQRLAALQRDVFGYELYRGTLVAEDGSAACILVRPQSEQQADRIYRVLEKRLADYPTGGEKLVVAGEAAVRAHMGAAVSDDALRMNFICPVVMALLIIAAYRTLRGTILPLCVIGGASTMALGLMSLGGVPVYIVTNGIFVVIMAVGVADAMHLLGQYYEEQLHVGGRSRQELIVDACMALWYPVLVTSLTDIAGFFSLYVVGIMPPIRYFGLFTSLGVLGALLYSYTVVPAGLAILPLKMSKAFMHRARNDGAWSARVDVVGRTLGWIARFAYRRRDLVLASGAALSVLIAWGASRMIVNDARILAFKPHHPIVRAADALNDRFDGTSHLNIVVTASEPGALLRADLLRRIEQLETYTESLDYVGGTHSVAGWVKRAHQKMNREDEAYYAIPDDPAVTRYYLDVLSADTSPMARLLHEVIDKTYTQANLTLRMKSSQFIHQRAVIESLQTYLDEHFGDGPLRAELAGRVNLDYHWLRMIRTEHVRSVALTFLCVLLLTGAMFRSAVAGLLCTGTVAVAVVTIYAIMGFGGIPLGVGTSMFASIAIGAGVNFPIHVLDRLRIGLRDSPADPAEVFRDTFTFTGRALFYTALVVAVGFLLLCVSEFRTLVRFGLLISTGMVVSFLTSISLLPAIVAAVKPRCIWGKKPAPGDGG